MWIDKTIWKEKFVGQREGIFSEQGQINLVGYGMLTLMWWKRK